MMSGPRKEMPIRVVVASHNPVKMEAVRSGFERMFPQTEIEVQAVNVPSGVSHQPMSDAETLQGALNRAGAARLAVPRADFWAGVEGGVEQQKDGLSAFAWVVILSPDRCGKARSATFDLPPALAEMIQQGVELGEADDRLFGRQNSKQQNGAVGLLTGDVIDRARYYEQAVVLALIPFKNPHLYPPGGECR
ncbi:MAG: inosine/xanthosine triphosphatase [Chloroflexota bacterium]